jgi:ParB/RepB/Spo0J family partition protein
MEIKKLKLSQLVTDKKNPRIDYEEIEELANSIQKNKQLQPLSVEDLRDGHFLIMDGHRRKMAFDLIKKKTKTDPVVECLITTELSEDERLVKRAAIDAQTKNLSVPERDELWVKIWKKNKYSEQEFAKNIGVPSSQVKHFLDRQNLTPSIKKLNMNAGILQETISLPKEHREKVLKYASKTGIGAMGLRQQVKELKGASDVLVNSFTKQEIDIDAVKQLKGLREDKQELAIANIVANKKHIAKIPTLVKDTKIKPKNEAEQKRITAQIFMNRLNDEISKTGTQIRLIRAVLEQIEEDKIEEHLNVNMKKGTSEMLSSLIDDVNEASALFKTYEKKWRKK